MKDVSATSLLSGTSQSCGRRARAHLLDTFDTDNALKVANFKGNEADLEAIQFPGTYTLEQVLAGDIPKDGIKLKETKEV